MDKNEPVDEGDMWDDEFRRSLDFYMTTQGEPFLEAYEHARLDNPTVEDVRQEELGWLQRQEKKLERTIYA
jgi:hypothetical protein